MFWGLQLYPLKGTGFFGYIFKGKLIFLQPRTNYYM